jgi:hypothetical protein
MSTIITFLITQLASALISENVFSRVEATVARWNAKEINAITPALSGADKQKAVLAELEIIGINLEGWLANLAIELAVAKTKTLVPVVSS